MTFLAIAASPVSAAIPGRPNPEDVKAIDTCLADAASAGTDPDGCIGRVTNECAKSASTTNGIEACSDRELLVWNFALTRDYAQLTSLVTDGDVKQALGDAEREFVLEKLKKCSFERIAHKDSPKSLVAAGRCDVRATARQDFWLQEQINSLKPH